MKTWTRRSFLETSASLVALTELNSFNYHKTIVEHKFARDRVLKVYADWLKK
jgi:alpha-beta hydrolase superfamily lysophospholipase